MDKGGFLPRCPALKDFARSRANHRHRVVDESGSDLRVNVAYADRQYDRVHACVRHGYEHDRGNADQLQRALCESAD